MPDLAGVGVGRSILVDRKRRIKAHLPPVRDSIGPFASAIERTMGDETARKIGLLAAIEGVVRVQLKRPLPHLGNLGIVDLDLVDGACRDRGGDEQNCRKRHASWEIGEHFETHQHAGGTICCLGNAS